MFPPLPFYGTAVATNPISGCAPPVPSAWYGSQLCLPFAKLRCTNQESSIVHLPFAPAHHTRRRDQTPSSQVLSRVVSSAFPGRRHFSTSIYRITKFQFLRGRLQGSSFNGSPLFYDSPDGSQSNVDSKFPHFCLYSCQAWHFANVC